MRVGLIISISATTAVSGAVLRPADTNVSAGGINCEGSIKCNGQPHNTAEILVQDIDGIDLGREYNNGQHIACRNNICAFLQGQRAPTSGAAIRSVAHYIVEHGCKVCGSVPTSAGNDDAYGELTFNFVSETACGEGGMC
ncbi:Kp4-domain-containing protein [Mycena leptocephala]|jgi:hypothetical protein|nr:Kp4-domain-containing protein [Mycena leptocephala]